MPVAVTIDEYSGFCFGVINAIRTAENYLENHDFLYCLGDIVHNNEEVARLSALGLRIISHGDFVNLKDTTVLIRAHGEPPVVYDIAKKNSITLIDATCPVVLKLQKRIAEDYSANSGLKQILIFGKKGHAEVVGLLGQTEDSGLVISSVDDVENVDFSKPATIYSQTTQNLEQYYSIIDLIKKRYMESAGDVNLEFHDTICRKVASRAQQIADFARRFDLIVFVTGEKSSNGKYLSDVCRNNNSNTFIVAKPEQVDEIDLSSVKTVGICGATSTPMWLMREIAARCTKNSEIQENLKTN